MRSRATATISAVGRRTSEIAKNSDAVKISCVSSHAFPKACKMYWEDKNRSFDRVFAIDCSDLVLCSDEEGETQGRALQGIIGTMDARL